MAATNNDSPGNAYYPNSPPMRRPGLKFLYRLECTIASEEINIGAPNGTGVFRSIANITGGTFKGPNLEGTVLPLGGADWATVIEGTHSMTLDARYTIKTVDDHYLFVQAHGLYRPGPGTQYAKQVAENPAMRPPPTVTQDDVEFFSHLRIETAGKYNWLNGLVCVGLMGCEDDRIIIDAYYLTNFVGLRPEDVMMRRENS
ncbi:DUF3237 domain-containing protein [Aspergillus fischeri NRRL 181]|uniref:Uncharacterized protein n=1 Tax=Neosartorya fischeri (strain ATCC 1020 / DSM 3700 / CBS 544.65 / FGSC A1164 / JCM 1740 / NRRL 181 / WB 181) TaxID=331117 RepID=A1D0W3_NEOFI|nr:conserved hypothetical protein [Aspergillus fischeri NRRL 181]EAW24633.1 conserved hypothetical protein [Aspergillus fischeri NRRL 181]KAG2002727.1 hypothetical protein GB937_009599 [Aspergillus fischeri]